MRAPLGVALIVLVLCAVVGCRAEPPVVDRRVAVSDPAAGLDAGSAYLRAVFLMTSGQGRAALPFFQHAIELRSGLWQAHYDYAVALIDVAFEVVPGRGLPHPAVRSSLERTALVKEALAELELAERYTTTTSNRAVVQHARATQLATWGMRWEALRDLDKAVSSDPARWRADLERQVEEMMWGAGAPVK